MTEKVPKPEPEVLTEGDIVKEQVDKLRREVNEVIDDLNTFERRRRRRRGGRRTKKIRSTT